MITFERIVFLSKQNNVFVFRAKVQANSPQNVSHIPSEIIT